MLAVASFEPSSTTRISKSLPGARADISANALSIACAKKGAALKAGMTTLINVSVMKRSVSRFGFPAHRRGERPVGQGLVGQRLVGEGLIGQTAQIVRRRARALARYGTGQHAKDLGFRQRQSFGHVGAVAAID